MKYRLLSIAALVLGACQPADAEDGSGDDGSSDDWTVDDPEHVVYDDSKLPRADLGDDPETAAVPFAIVGEDSGEGGIIYAAALAGYYIMGVQWDEQGYHYQYDPSTDSFDESDNIWRKSGATFTQAWLYRLTQRDDFRWSTYRGLKYLTAGMKDLGDGAWELRDLGGTSLITLSMTYYDTLSGSDEFDVLIDGAGKYLLDRIGEDGSFTVGVPLQWAQAHQALWRLYDYTDDVRYLDALEKVAKYFYDNRNDPDVIDFPYLYGLWANEPITDMYQVRPKDWMSQQVLEIGDDVASKQYTPANNDNDVWMGGYWPNSGEGGEPNWNSTLKLEATIEAWRMATIVGDDERAERFRKSAIIGAEFLMRMQYRTGETDGFADPGLPIGGITASPTNPVIRIDIPHHGANAIMKVAEYMELEDFPGGPL